MNCLIESLQQLYSIPWFSAYIIDTKKNLKLISGQVHIAVKCQSPIQNLYFFYYIIFSLIR